MRIRKTYLACTLLYLCSASTAHALSTRCDDVSSETRPESSDYDLSFTFGLRQCLPDTAMATIVAYAFDNRIQDDTPIMIAATWGPTPVTGYTTLRPGLLKSDLLSALESDGALEDVNYYFEYKVDLNGDGEICNGDLTADYSTQLLDRGSYPGTNLQVRNGIPLTAIEDTPCNKIPLEARDLDGDPTTIDAYYDGSQNITWLANANLAKSQSFGLNRGDPKLGSFLYQVTTYGRMESKTIESYINAMNAATWLGYSGWRNPTTRIRDDNCSQFISSAFFTSASIGTGCRSEMGNLFLARQQGSWSNGDFLELSSRYWSGTTQARDPSRQYVFNFNDGDQNVAFTTGRYGPLFHVWPVHNGDIGSPIETLACIDPDGDGWGWDGQKSCKITPTGMGDCDYTNAESFNGWGWNSVTRQSCPPLKPVVTACIDNDGDGWGWDGTKSCRI